MDKPPIPIDEPARVKALHSLHILDTPPEERFDRLTRLASRIFGVPIALVSLVDENRQWFKSRQGLDATETPRDISFCGHTIVGEDTLVVEDASEDPCFADNPLVLGPPGIRFYAGHPLRSRDGHTIGTLCIIDREARSLGDQDRQILRDFAHMVEQEILVAELATSDRMRAQKLDLKDKLLSHVSHELRTPLTAIHQFLSIVLDGIAGGLTAEQREYLGIAFRNTNQLKAMINDLMEATRAQAGKLRVEVRRIDLTSCIGDAVRAAEAHATASGIRVQAELARDLPAALADEARVRQILNNLLDNAVKFSPADSTITVAAAACPDSASFVRVSVIDQGCGIDKAAASRIFERLHQEGNAEWSSRTGLGLGLFICSELVQTQSGRISLESQEGQGTTFHVDLPVFAVADLIRPAVLDQGRLRQECSVLRVRLRPGAGAGEDRTVPDSLHRRIHHLLGSLVFNPRIDVLLPRRIRDADDALYVVAATGSEGARAIASRVERQLASLDDTARGELCFRVDWVTETVGDAPRDANPEPAIRDVARRIEDRLNAASPWEEAWNEEAS